MAVYRTWMQAAPAVDASCAALGAWLRLQSHASADGVENPVIVGAKGWADRKWLVVANVERADVDRVVESGLARWQGDDLEVLGFDADGLAAIEARRRGGREAWRGRKKGSPDSSATRPAVADRQVSDSSASAERKVSDSSSKPLSSPLPSSPSPSQEIPPGGAPTGAQGLIARFCEGWKAKYGGRYIVMPKDAQAVANLLKAHPVDLDVWEGMVARYLADTSNFHAERRHPLEHLANNPNAFRGQKSERRGPQGEQAGRVGWAPAVVDPSRVSGEVKL